MSRSLLIFVAAAAKQRMSVHMGAVPLTQVAISQGSSYPCSKSLLYVLLSETAYLWDGMFRTTEGYDMKNSHFATCQTIISDRRTNANLTASQRTGHVRTPDGS
ncbi:hypothetical protein CPB85DRAFT_1256503 [Mucidula mucida]|nr:hypothetical protein CPB85DRAFT_1256503 [Mucidula mucida]